MMTLEQWKNQTQERLHNLAQTLGKMTPGMTYGALVTSTIYPLLTALQQADTNVAALIAVINVANSLGINLLAEQLGKWKDRSEEDLRRNLAQEAKSDPALREMLDQLLEKAEAPSRIVQAILSEADKDELKTHIAESLQKVQMGLQEVGSRLVIEGDFVAGDKVGGDQFMIGDISNSTGVAVGRYITQIINLYRQPSDHLNEAELQQQIRSYLEWVCDRYGKISLLGVEYRGQNVIDLDLEQVYVPLQATTRTPKPVSKTRRKISTSSRKDLLEDEMPHEQMVDIALDQLLSLAPQLIVTGGPGCGKTTVLQHIAWTLANALATDDPALAQGKLGVTTTADPASTTAQSLLPLPIYIPLSRYATYRRELRRRGIYDDPHKIRLSSFISNYLIERETAPRLPTDFFARLLEKEQSLILLLDGLDEVPNDEERRQVCRAIQDLVAGKPSLRVVVTCRTAACKGETMLDADFHPVQVKALDDGHVSTLVEHAFRCIERVDKVVRQQKTAELINGIRNFEKERAEQMGERYRRLIDSPLMVRLLLLVFLTGRGFPQQRADLYERSTRALLKPDYTLDDETASYIGEQVGGNPGQHRALVEYIAFQMHQAGEAQGRDRSEDELKRLLRDSVDFAPLTEAFLQLTRVRGSLMEERMRSYRFFHLSFQEYLAACYLAKTRLGEGGVDALARFFEEGALLDPWWREPALLVAGHFVSSEDVTNARRFVRRLAGCDEAATQRDALPVDLQLAAAEIALLSCHEWMGQDVSLRNELTKRVETLFADKLVMGESQPSLRAAVGNALNYLGDPRPGVVRVANPKQLAIADLAWSDLIGKEPFTMGSDKRKDRSTQDNETPQFTCSLIKHPYRISRYPITVAHYRIFIDNNGYAQEKYWTQAGWQWRRKNKISEPERYSAIFELDNHPQVGVSWYEAVAFCNWLSEQNGLPLNDLLRSIRLPSEAEWERAARGTEGQIYPWKGDWDEKKCNNTYLGLNATSAVGIFPAGNAACGVADMSGNVWEWCSTKWTANYQDYLKKVDDKLEGGDRRVLRGGSFDYYEYNVRCAYRYHRDPSYRNLNLGFRVMLPDSGSLVSSVLCSL